MNLDLQLDLLDSGGNVIDTDNPISALVGAGVREPATGLDATVGTTANGGDYYVRVDGVGNGTGTTAYSDYGSTGAYVLDFTGTCGNTGAPDAPTAVTATSSGATRSASVSWTAPARVGGGPVIGYTVSVNGVPAATTATPGAMLTGLPLGRPLAVSVTATNAAGTGPTASAAPFTLTARPGAPAIGRVKSGKRGGKKTIKVTWSAPADSGGTPITGYQVQVLKKSGKLVRTVGLAASTTSLTTTFKHRGRYRFVVVAVNAVGAGPPSAPSRAVAAR